MWMSLLSMPSKGNKLKNDQGLGFQQLHHKWPFHKQKQLENALFSKGEFIKSHEPRPHFPWPDHTETQNQIVNWQLKISPRTDSAWLITEPLQTYSLLIRVCRNWATGSIHTRNCGYCLGPLIILHQLTLAFLHFITSLSQGQLFFNKWSHSWYSSRPKGKHQDE